MAPARDDAEKIKTELRHHLVQTYLPGEDPSQLTDDLELRPSGVLTSVNTLELVDHLEGQYRISLTPHEIATQLGSIREIADLVIEKASAPLDR